MKRTLFAAILIALGSGLTAAPAQATHINGCWTQWYGKVGEAWCETRVAGNYFRARVTCNHTTPVGSVDHYYRYGPWKWQTNSPDWSTAFCNTGDTAGTVQEQVSS